MGGGGVDIWVVIGYIRYNSIGDRKMQQFILKVIVGSVVFVITSLVTLWAVIRLMIMFNLP